MMDGLSKTRARWGCVLVVLLAGCQSKPESVDHVPASNSGPAAAPGPKEAKKDGPRANSPRFAFVSGTLREVPGGQPEGLPCVQGVLERGTPVVILGIKEGRTCRLVAGEHSSPIVGAGDCTVLEGPCDLKDKTLGVVGVSEVAVRSVEPSIVGGEEGERAMKEAAAVAKDLKPHDWCVVPEGPVTLTPESARRPLGVQSPILLVQFKETRGGTEGAGPLIALPPARPIAPWGYPASGGSGFLLNGKPYLWGAGFSYGCGARVDTIYAVEEGATLRAVLSSGFLGD